MGAADSPRRKAIEHFIKNDLLEACKQTAPSRRAAEAVTMLGKTLVELARTEANDPTNQLDPIPAGATLHIAEAVKWKHLFDSQAKQVVIIASKCAAGKGVANLVYSPLLTTLGEAVTLKTDIRTVVVDIATRQTECRRKQDSSGAATNGCVDLTSTELGIMVVVLPWIVDVMEQAGLQVHRVVIIHQQLTVAQIKLVLRDMPAGSIAKAPHYRNLTIDALPALFTAVGAAEEDTAARTRYAAAFSQLQSERCEYSFSQQPKGPDASCTTPGLVRELTLTLSRRARPY